MDMIGIILVEGFFGVCGAGAAFLYQRKMDREVAAGQPHRWSQHFSAGHSAYAGGGAPAGRSPRATAPAAVHQAYSRLGVAPGATPEEIRRAYHKQCIRWHPDRFARASAAEQAQASRMMTQLNAAYALLQPRQH